MDERCNALMFYLEVTYADYGPDWDEPESLAAFGIKPEEVKHTLADWDLLVERLGYDPIDEVGSVLDKVLGGRPGYLHNGELGIATYRLITPEQARGAVEALYASKYYEQQSLYIEAHVNNTKVAQMDVAWDGRRFIEESEKMHAEAAHFIRVHHVLGEAQDKAFADAFNHEVLAAGRA